MDDHDEKKPDIEDLDSMFKKQIINNYLEENSESVLIDKLKALDMSRADIEVLRRLPVSRKSLNVIVDGLIYEKAMSSE